jgi:hypothetical protein
LILRLLWTCKSQGVERELRKCRSIQGSARELFVSGSVIRILPSKQDTRHPTARSLSCNVFKGATRRLNNLASWGVLQPASLRSFQNIGCSYDPMPYRRNLLNGPITGLDFQTFDFLPPLALSGSSAWEIVDACSGLRH